MLPVNIVVKSHEDIRKINNHQLYSHIKDISNDKIISFTVNFKEKNTQTIGYDTIEDILSELIVIYVKDSSHVKREIVVKTTITTKKTPIGVIKRKNIKKFGLAAISNDGTTIIGKDNIFIEKYNDDDKPKSRLNSEDISIIETNPDMKFSQRNKLKTFSPNRESSKYIPPHKKNRNNGNSKNNANKYTIFISGFDEYFTRNDFLNIIPNNITYIRISLPTNGNNKCKGFGFIDVNDYDSMQNLINFFDGKLYNNMVLHANEKKFNK